MACVIGGSCAYATPIGMPANTMVIGAGGYTFKDYAKAGVPFDTCVNSCKYDTVTNFISILSIKDNEGIRMRMMKKMC